MVRCGMVWYARYVNICGAIVDDVSPEYFVETFLPHLFALAIDKVPTSTLHFFLSVFLSSGVRAVSC